jgi:tetratricopeptide (TPR) repeat protein
MRIETLFLALPFAVAPAAAAPSARVAAAARESADELIARGRAALAEGKLDDAQAAFDAAAALEASPRTRVWVVRGWIARGATDEALIAVDELKAARAPASDVDYLYGLAFHAAAAQAVASGSAGAFTQSQFQDAVAYLKRALAADAERYRDAWLALADAAWNAPDLETAAAAAAKAAEIEPANAAAHLIRGRVAFSRYSSARESDPSAAEALWKDSLAAFETAARVLGAPSERARMSQLADALVQIAYLHQWKQDVDAAAVAYSAAMAWDPALVDFGAVRSLVGAERFAAMVAAAVPQLEKRRGERDPVEATLLWWHGFAQFEASRFAESEAAFRRTLELWPSYVNSWYYVFRCAYSQQRFADALAALERYFEADPDGLAAALASQPELNLPIVEYLVGWCANGANHGGEPKNDKAALLCEMLTRARPEVARYWNNLGLFLRDHGEQMRLRDKDVDPALLARQWEAAYAAYQRTLELEPENPNYLNDTAVMLHYYLDRELDRALAMYEKAARRADEELARKDLSPTDREIVQIAKRDSNDNLRKLKRLMERRAQGEKVKPENE